MNLELEELDVMESPMDTADGVVAVILACAAGVAIGGAIAIFT